YKIDNVIMYNMTRLRHRKRNILRRNLVLLASGHSIRIMRGAPRTGGQRAGARRKNEVLPDNCGGICSQDKSNRRSQVSKAPGANRISESSPAFWAGAP